ncbi:hypothetical protein WJX73_006472 [Symbiochloris irregularis]|uniref:RWP-RK domain-containing protein n=1 Tax=Symbiochloris irregularis TaxID=706552 RepID=A0AAW1NV36_9CHLO
MAREAHPCPLHGQLPTLLTRQGRWIVAFITPHADVCTFEPRWVVVRLPEGPGVAAEFLAAFLESQSAINSYSPSMALQAQDAGNFNQASNQPLQINEVELHGISTVPHVNKTKVLTKGQTTYEEVASFFHLPIDRASKDMSICATVLKKICRGHGLPRWPYRKVCAQHIG